ncbi:MAG: tetratricopeptide repeat protein [Candidatus Amulumruptor sp.]
MKISSVLLAAMLCVSAYTTAQESFNLILSRANKAENAQDWAAAEKEYKQLITSYPESKQISQIVANLSLVQSLQGRDSVAIATLDDGLAKNASDTLLLERRGQLRMNAGDMAGAIADYGKLTEINPDAFYAFYIHGSLALNSGDTVAAKKSFLRLRELVPGSEADHKAWAAYNTKIKDYPAAIAEYNALIAQKPEIEAYLGRAAAHMMLEQLDDASMDIADAMRLDPNDGEAYYLRAGLNKKRYQFDSAKEDGKKAISLGVDPRRVELLLGALPDGAK